MSVGYVREFGGQLLPMYPIYIEGPSGKSDVYIAQIDTGFSGQVILPRNTIQELELEIARVIEARFANSKVEEVNEYRAALFWDGNWREVSVLETGDTPLIGMELLRGSSVCFDAADSGQIEIEPIDANAN